MLRITIGDEVKVQLPEGRSSRGVEGIHVMHITSPEARFEGAVGVVAEINPRSSHGIPQFLVDFSTRDNPWIPYQAEWFRENWLEPTDKPGVGDQPEGAAVVEESRISGGKRH